MAATFLPHSVSPTSNTTTASASTASSTQAQQNVVVSATPLPAQQTPSMQDLYPSPTYNPSRIATTIRGDKWTSVAQDSGIVKGYGYSFGFYVFTSPDMNKKICGQYPNFYIDDKPAPGTWNVNSNPECWVSAQLLLSADDIAKLSLGMHTLKVDYMGDTTYAPSHWEGTFNVEAT